MVTKAQVNTLITRYSKAYETKQGRKPLLNRYKAKWGFEAMAEDYGFEGAAAIIDYYVENGESPDVNRLLSTYEQVKDTMDKSNADREYIQQLLKDTKRRMNERGTGTIELGTSNEGHSPATQQ